jgi:D-aminoacyl-tRNA deacylase
LYNTLAPDIINIPTNYSEDALVVLSTHKSKNPQKAFTIHYPGNWDRAEFGGEDKTLNMAPASLMKNIAIELNKAAIESGYEFTLEADHHGPTTQIPVVYAEIGTETQQWEDMDAIRKMASAIVMGSKKQKKYETFLAVGGGHYPKEFNLIEIDENEEAVGHILPKYLIDKIDEKTLLQGIEKSVEKVNKVRVIKESLNAKQKAKIKDFCDKYGIEMNYI